MVAPDTAFWRFAFDRLVNYLLTGDSNNRATWFTEYILFHSRMDAITSTGYVEGWAFDTDAPFQPLTVSVLAKGREVAKGIANLYRWDLADAGCGTGWCAFRLRLSLTVSRLRRQSISLWDAAQQTEIHPAVVLPLAEDQEPRQSALKDIVAADPTLVHGIEQLRACGPAFSAFVAAEGASKFVRAAYIYILGRPVDASGLAIYAEMLTNESLLPYDLLKTLYESDEYQSAPRPLIAPPEPGFVFRRS